MRHDPADPGIKRLMPMPRPVRILSLKLFSRREMGIMIGLGREEFVRTMLAKDKNQYDAGSWEKVFSKMEQKLLKLSAR